MATQTKTYTIGFAKPNYAKNSAGRLYSVSTMDVDTSVTNYVNYSQRYDSGSGLLFVTITVDTEHVSSDFDITLKLSVGGSYTSDWIKSGSHGFRHSTQGNVTVYSYTGSCSTIRSASFSGGIDTYEMTIAGGKVGGSDNYQPTYPISATVVYGTTKRTASNSPDPQDGTSTFTTVAPNTSGIARWESTDTPKVTVAPGGSYSWQVSDICTTQATKNFLGIVEYKANLEYYIEYYNSSTGASSSSYVGTLSYVGTSDEFSPLALLSNITMPDKVGYTFNNTWRDAGGEVTSSTTYSASTSSPPTHQIYARYYRILYGPFTFKFNTPSYWSPSFATTYPSFKVTGSQGTSSINTLISYTASTGDFTVGPFDYADGNKTVSLSASWGSSTGTAIGSLTPITVSSSLTTTMVNAKQFNISFYPSSLSKTSTYNFSYVYGITKSPLYYDYYGNTYLGAGTSSTYTINDSGNVTIAFSKLSATRLSTTNPESSVWDIFKNGWSLSTESSVGSTSLTYGTKNYADALRLDCKVYEAWQVYKILGPYTIKLNLMDLNDDEASGVVGVMDTYFKGISSLTVKGKNNSGTISNGYSNLSSGWGSSYYYITFNLHKECTKCELSFNLTLGTLFSKEAVSLTEYTTTNGTVSGSKGNLTLQFNLNSSYLGVNTIELDHEYTVRCFPRVYNYNGTKSSTPSVHSQTTTIAPNMSLKFYLPNLTTDSDRGNITAGQFGAPNSRYDTFLGWKHYNSDNNSVAWSINKAGTIASGYLSYLDWVKDYKSDGSIFYPIQEAWDVPASIGAYSFQLKAPGGISEVDTAYTIQSFEVLFLDENKQGVTVTHQTSLQGHKTDRYTLATTGSSVMTQLNSMVYIVFQITYRPSVFLRAANEISWTYPLRYDSNDSKDNVSINITFDIATLRKQSLTTFLASATYTYNSYLNYKDYLGSKILKTSAVQSKILTNGKLSYSYNALARLSKTEDYPFYWFYKGWDKTPHPEYVDDGRTEEQSKQDNAPYGTNSGQQSSIPFEVSYSQNVTPNLIFNVYEIFKLGWGYQVILKYLTNDSNEPDIDKVSLVPENTTFQESYSFKTEDSWDTVTVTCQATSAKKRGYVWSKWSAGNGINSMSGRTCVVDLTTAIASPETTRVRIKEAYIVINWIAVTWQRNIWYYKNTTKAIENWPSTSNPHKDYNEWKFTKNNAPIFEPEGKSYDQYVTKNNEFLLPVKLRGTEKDYLREDDYQLSEWTEVAVSDSNESEITPSYDPGGVYTFGAWRNITQSSGTLDVKLYARWVEGTLAYIYNESLKKWQRGIPYICNGGSSWSKAIIK